MKFFKRFTPLAPACLAVLFMISPAAADEKEAELFVRSLAEQAIMVLRDDKKPLETREARLRALLSAGFAMDTIGRYVVGAHWEKMSAEQQSEYQTLFSEWTLRSYSTRLGGYKDQEFEVLNAVDSGKKDIFVRTRINQPNGGKPVNCAWRIRKVNDQYKIVDIDVEGISMLITQKREFESLLNRQGVNGLIEMLKMRNSKFPAMAG